MAKPFDNITKQLVEMRPHDWLRFLNIEADTVEVVNSDLTTALEADRVLKIIAPVPQIVHLEFQTSYEPMGLRLLRYNIALHHAYDIPVESVLVLLRPAADGAGLTGMYRIPRPRRQEPYLWFEYDMIRVWQIPMERFLTGALGLLPFAAIAEGISEENAGAVLRQIESRLVREAGSQSEVADLLFSSFVLMATRFERGFIEKLKAEVGKMRDSVLYDIILDEGRAEGITEGRAEGMSKGIREGESTGRRREALSLILRLGNKRFGEATDAIRSRLDAIASTEDLEEVALRLMDVESWDELLPADLSGFHTEL